MGSASWRRVQARRKDPRLNYSMSRADARSGRSSATISRWATDLLSDEHDDDSGASDEIVRVEEYRLQSAKERLRLPADLPDEVPLEVVLHAAGDARYSYVLDAFEDFAEQLGVDADLDRRLPIDQLAEFSFLRVARPMPRLRLLEPVDTIARAADIQIAPPTDPPADPEIRVAVFDGGVEAGSPLAPWVTSKDVPGIAAPGPEYLEHGLMVSSAILFGSIDPETDPVLEGSDTLVLSGRPEPLRRGRALNRFAQPITYLSLRLIPNPRERTIGCFIPINAS